MQTTESIGKYLALLHRQSALYVQRELIEFDINMSEISYLKNLCKNDGITQKQLADEIFVDKAATTRTINNLVSKGYVNKISNDDDKRKYNIYLTDKARIIIDTINAKLSKWNKILEQGFDIDKVGNLIEVLKKMSKNAIEYNNFDK
ncbi:MAG: MarR family transcriptional regulator [Clostridia bacterium]